MTDRTIVALATPRGLGAIHIVRVSGSDCFPIVQKISKSVVDRESRVQIVFLQDNYLLDQVVLVKYFSPKSFTGEDLIEINCHGSNMVVDLIIQSLVRHGAFEARRGEFSRRAYQNKKINLDQAMSTLSIFASKSRGELDCALRGLSQEGSRRVQGVIQKLFGLLATAEINVDYPPEIEGDESVLIESIRSETRDCLGELKELYETSMSRSTSNPRIVIVGKPNSGKSTLINCLLGLDRAIVSESPGTTRDSLEFELYIDRLFTVVDTAGIRDDPETNIESMGIVKTNEEIEKADLVVQLIGPDQEELAIKKSEVIRLYSKADLIKEKQAGRLYISAKRGDVASLFSEIKKFFKNKLSGINYQEGVNLIANAIQLLKESLNEELTLDLISEYLTSSRATLLEIFWAKESDNERINKIFDNFCVGK